MRIVTWNCQMGLDKKADALLSLNPDVAVIPECSEKSSIAFRERRFNSLWFGCNPHKGLGVFCRKDWEIQPLSSPDQKWIVPIKVNAVTPFTLIAIWACRVGSRNVDNYVGQVYYALTSHPEWFNGNPVILAGDLNSNTIWDSRHKVINHSTLVKILADRGLVSGYHHHFREMHGVESSPTIYFRHHEDKPYHIDYIFIPETWLPRLTKAEVGSFERWSKLSDHCPVVVDIQY